MKILDRLPFSFARLFYCLYHGGLCGLRAYEVKCVALFERQLDAMSLAIFDSQLRSLLGVQRAAQGREVRFFFHRQDTMPVFANTSFSHIIARLWIATQDRVSQSSEIICDLCIYRGRIYSLEFSKSPSELKGGFKVNGVTLYKDPAKHIYEAKCDAPYPDRWISKLDSLITIENLISPLPESYINNHLEILNCAVPTGYNELLHESNGFVASGWKFLGTNTWRLFARDANYWIAAERDPLYLCFLEGSGEANVYLYEAISEEVTEMGNCFIDSFIKVVTEKKYQIEFSEEQSET